MSERPAHTANRATSNPLKLGETVQIRKNLATGRIPKSRAHGNDTKSVASGISFIEGELAPYLTALWGRGSMGELTGGAMWAMVRRLWWRIEFTVWGWVYDWKQKRDGE